MKRKVLLLEPNYKNKYPPMGLMKLATYHRMQGYDVTFYKGDLSKFVQQEITEEAISNFESLSSPINWRHYYLNIFEYIRYGKHDTLNRIREETNCTPIDISWLEYYRKFYRSGQYFTPPRWDRVCVTTLFTFYWDITIKTILFAKKLVKNPREILVGGVMASVVPDVIEKETGVKPHEGPIYAKKILSDEPINIKIDDLTLDYSILDEIDYEYPEYGSYYGYMTRGCKNHCPFCVVPVIEPKEKSYISIKRKIKKTNAMFGEQHNLLLLDNNVLASKDFDKIIDEIKDCGFVTGAKYILPNHLDIAVKLLRKSYNDKACINKVVKLLSDFLDRLEEDEQKKLYRLLEQYDLLSTCTATKGNVLAVYEEVKELYENKRLKSVRNRYVDFNQGVDARELTEEKMAKLSEIPIRPLRIAFDHWALRKIYEKAITLAAKYKVTNLSNYLLYNFNDKPIELYYRMRLNIELCDRLGVNIYSFPMKYHPIKETEYLRNREYIGKHWNRKFIRAIQAVLNATKGKIGKGKSFFYKAFGQDESEFEKILYMPEAFIIYRKHFEDNGKTEQWWSAFSNLNSDNRTIVEDAIKTNDFTNIALSDFNAASQEVLHFYMISRDDAEKELAIK